MVSARRDIVLTLPLCAMGLILVSAAATAQQKFTIKSVAEKKLARLPAGPLYWRIETFPTLARAEAAAGPAALAAEVAGKVWLFTLGPEGGSTPGGSEVALIGPVPLFSATEYLLRINHASGPPGARTPVHNHPGSETFYLLTGQLTQKTPQGVAHVEAGHAMLGHPPGTTMEVSSTGTSDLSALVMFLADATKPFSVPARFQ
jgi:quercetin dioxygenase-like cupin family protein